jgi:hypothetical protein
MIVDNIRAALQQHDPGQAKALVAALRHFIGEHKAKLTAAPYRGR